MTHKELQNLEEQVAMKPLLKELHIDDVSYSDKPDARVSYEGKMIGIEVVGYHRSEVNMGASSALNDSLKKYENIINARGERGKQISVMIDEEQAVFYTKSDEEQLFREIENSRNGIDDFSRYVLFADSDPILPPNDKCFVARCGIAFCQNVSVEKLQSIITKKESRLQQYKMLSKNQDLNEYWLVIYVNQHEYDYFQGQQLPKIESVFNRIYLTHSSDGVLLIKS